METTHRPKKKKRLLVAALVLAAVLLLSAGVCAGFLVARHNAGATASGGEAAQKQKVLQEVAKIYLLPTTEDPTVAIIQNKAAIGSEAFFKNAQNGDYVILYKKIGLGIVYRQSQHKIINIATVAFGAVSPTATTPAGN